MKRNYMNWTKFRRIRLQIIAALGIVLALLWAAVFVVVGQPVDGILVHYYEQRRAYFGGGILFSVVLISLVLIAFAKLRREEQADRDLRESEARYRALTGLSADWYWELDEAYRFSILSAATASARAGGSPEKHLGRTPWELRYSDPAGADWQAFRALVEARQSFRDVVLKAVGRNGRTAYLNVRGDPVYDGAGNFKGFRGVTNDVTRSKRNERLLELEHAVNRCLADAADTPTALKTAIRAICETEGWESGRYLRLDEKAGVLRFGEAWSVPSAAIERFLENSRTAVYGPGVGLVGSVWQSGQPLWVPDTSKDVRTMRKNLAREAGLHGAIFFPVLSEGKTIGVLTFNSREVREPDDRLLRAVSVIGSQIGQFVQRKQAEDVLRQSEERFRSLTGLSSDIYWEQDDQFRFISMAGTGSHGSDTRNLPRIGKKRWEENFVNMSPDAWAAHIALLEARKPFHDLELCRLHESGKKTWGSVSGEPVFDASGAFKGYRGVGKDITERKRAEQLRELEHAVNRSLAAADSASAGLKAVIRAVCETEGWECGRYFLLDEEAGLLRFADAWSVPDPAFERFIAGSRDHVYRPGVGLSGRAWQLGRPLWATDVTNDPRTSSGAANAGPSHAIGIHGAFVFPVLADGKTIGVLNFANRKAREPEEQLLQAISVIGSQIGQFVQRKQAEEVLRKSEERFRSLTQLSYDVYWEQDEQYRFTSLNGPDWMKTAQSKLLGATRWEQNYLNITPEGWAAHIAVLDAREPFHDLELCRLDQRGERVWISVSGEPMFDESGAFRGYRGVGKDITARKRDEMVLRLEHTVTRCLAESDSASVAMQEVVRAVCETFDWECGRYFRVDEAAGVLRFGEAWAVPGAEMERYIARWREVSYVRGVGLAGLAWQSGEPQWAADLTSDPRISRRAIACDAGMRGAFVFPATSEGKVLGVFAFNSLEVREPDERLLTSIKVIGSQIGQFLQRKQGEEILRKSEERFNLAVRATNDVIWDWNLVTDELWWNENITNVFGYGEGEIGRTNKAWHDRIHPEDQDRISSAVRRVIDSGGESWSDEYSFRRQDGTYARVFDRGHVIRDDSGRAVRMIGAMADITVRKEAEERLAYLAQFDSLTGLPNRHLFRDRLMQTMARARRADKPMAVLFIDLDRFKLVNDTLGHSAGDRLLKEATQRLQSCVRSSDTVGRFGGDEFGAILTDLAKPADASLVAQKIIDALARPFHLDGHESYVTASIGITLFPSDGEEAGTLIMNADAAMYRAKEQGRNAYQYFTREMNERAMQRVKMETALRRAIERKEFLLHYQPKVNLDSGEVCGFEALLRWQHPARGLVPPLEFIPVLEDTGLIVAVGEWVIGEVCGQIRNWQQSGLTVPPVAINLSARQFQQKGLEDAVRRMLAESDVDPSLLQFELTESLLMKDPEAAARTLQGLKDSGVKLSVDDFGTGYSSLSYLKRFPIDALKIDRTFIGDVTVDPDDAAITLAIIGLGHSLKLNVIAEGVETEGQLEFLKAHACDEMQGYLFSRPVGSDECARMLREGRRLGQTHGRVTRFPGPNGGRPSRARVGRG